MRRDDPAVLLRVANQTIVDARKAWRRNDGTIPRMEAAYRYAVLAARCARKAAAAWSHKPEIRGPLDDSALRLAAAAAELLPKLARLIEDGEPEAVTAPE